MYTLASVGRNRSSVNQCAAVKEKRCPAGFFLSSRRVPALRRDLRHVYDARRLALLTTDRYEKAEHEDHRPEQYRGEYHRGQHWRTHLTISVIEPNIPGSTNHWTFSFVKLV